jgi:peroxiredoxin
MLKMALTPSNMLPLGTTAPEFRLKDTNSNSYYSFDDLKGSKGTLVMFICNHCPFVLHVIDEVVKVANDYRVQGLGVIAISSNDVAQYPQDGPEAMAEFALRHKIGFPYLYDQTQEVAKAFDAACTPDFYLFDNAATLFYRGQLDDSRPGNNIPLSGSDLRNAIDALLYNRVIATPQKPSIGCNIKWKK